jgi:NADH-quinone oxidoreductase subunit G
MLVEMVNLYINGKEVAAPTGSTIMQAADLAGIEIPRLCYDPDLSALGACRLCVVEVKGNFVSFTIRTSVGIILPSYKWILPGL